MMNIIFLFDQFFFLYQDPQKKTTLSSQVIECDLLNNNQNNPPFQELVVKFRLHMFDDQAPRCQRRAPTLNYLIYLLQLHQTRIAHLSNNFINSYPLILTQFRIKSSSGNSQAFDAKLKRMVPATEVFPVEHHPFSQSKIILV